MFEFMVSQFLANVDVVFYAVGSVLLVKALMHACLNDYRAKVPKK